MKIGYVRVSTGEQNPDMQRAALAADGCEIIFDDCGESGASRTRKGLLSALHRLAEGDVLVVWRLDRLGRSLSHLIEIIDQIGRKGAGFRSLSDAIDTTTAGGKLVFHVMGAMAEFERALIVERTRAGMTAAKRRGKHVGRPRKLTPYHIDHARELLATGRMSQASVAALLGVGVRTLRRALNMTFP
jgi:DNA invertase Pin-like site-specific DNA recombinase